MAALLTACATLASPAPPAAPLRPGCITAFDPGADYFQVKAEFAHATKFSLTYQRSYQVLTVRQPFPGGAPQSIVLLRSGAPTPQLPAELAGAGKVHNLMVIAPAHHRRVAAGILSWGQDIDAETLPFQVNLGYQVPRKKEADYIGKAALEQARDLVEAGNPPFQLTMVGMRLGGKPIDEYAPDFWLIRENPDGALVGYLTSPWWSPELESNIALGFVPVGLSALDTKLAADLPDRFADTPGTPVDSAPAASQRTGWYAAPCSTSSGVSDLFFSATT